MAVQGLAPLFKAVVRFAEHVEQDIIQLLGDGGSKLGAVQSVRGQELSLGRGQNGTGIHGHAVHGRGTRCSGHGASHLQSMQPSNW